MNKFIQAIKALDVAAVGRLLETQPNWIAWSEEDGKNALHYLGGVPISGDKKSADSLKILKLLLKKGMDMNSIHKIPERGGFFPATPLWYSYTRGRNKTLYTYLLKHRAKPDNCMFAIAWYNDRIAAALFMRHGAKIDQSIGGNTPFIAAMNWKRFDVARWFLKNGADVNATDEKGNTALFYAVKRKYEDAIVILLLQFGADVDKKNNDGVSPKKLAESNRQRKILGLLASQSNKN